MPTGGSQNSNEVLQFIGGVGTNDKGDNVPMGNTAKALIELGEFLIKKASDNLQKGGHVATGETKSSMALVNLQTQTTNMSVDVKILSTYKFLDQGVKGTEGGTGKYSFKTKYPSKKMADAILKWVRKRSIQGKTKYKPKSENEKKNVSLNSAVKSSDNQKSLSYAIATSIKKKGIDRTLFFSNAVRDTKELQKKKYAAAFKLDIIENLS